MKSNRVRTLGRKLVCIAASASMAALMVPAASLATVQSESSAEPAVATASKVSNPTITVKRASTGKLSMKVGASYKLGASASKGTLLYSSSNKKVVTVSSKGLLKAVKVGKANITVSIKGEGVAKKISVNVVKASKYKAVKSLKVFANANEEDPYSNVYDADTSVSIGKSTDLGAGSFMTLCAKFNPGSASNTNLIYKSSNNSVATVNDAGVLRCVGDGTAKITVTSCENSKAKGTFKVVSATAEDMAESAELACDGSVSSDCTTAVLFFDTDKPIKEELDIDDVTLSGLFSNYEVHSLYYMSENEFAITLDRIDDKSKAADDADDSYGYVMVGSSFFQEDVSYGFGAVSVQEPVAFIDSDSDLASFNADTGILAIGVDLGSAQASTQLGTSRISLPADEDSSIPIKRVTADTEDPSQIFIGFEIGNDGEGFESLDEFLTEGGIKIDAGAINCEDDLIVTSQDVEEGLEYGWGTTALDFLRPFVMAEVTNTEWSVNNNDGSIKGSLEVNMNSASSFADVDLIDSATVPNAVKWGTSDSSWLFSCSAKPQYQDKSTFKVTLELQKEDAELYGAFNEDGTPNAEVCNSLLENNLSYQDVVLHKGLVKNSLGVMQGAKITAPMFMDLDSEEESSYDSSLSAMSLSLMDDDEEDDSTIDYDTLRNYAAQLITAGGALAWGISSGDWGYITGGIGGLVGFEVVDDGPSTQDIMDKLDVIETTLNSVKDNVDRVNTRLKEIESRTVFEDKLATLRTLLTRTEPYAKPVNDGIKKIEADKTGDGTQTNEKQIADAKEMAENTKAIEDRRNFNSLNDTIDLGKMLYGDIGNSIVKEYADYVGTYYNWEPETCPSVAIFYARVSLAYESAYKAAYNERQVELREAMQTGSKAEIRSINNELDELAANHKLVTKAMVGELAEDGTTSPMGEVTVKNYKVKSESAIYKLTYADTSADSVKCLVNGRTYSKDVFRSRTFFGDNGRYDGFRFFNQQGDKVGDLDGNASITVDNWSTMIDRLNTMHPYENLYKELEGMGFDLTPGKQLWESRYCNSSEDHYKIHYWDLATAYYELLVGTARRTCICGSKGSWHDYEWRGPVVNLHSNSLNSAARVMSAEEKYYWHGWAFDSHWGCAYGFDCKWVLDA